MKALPNARHTIRLLSSCCVHFTLFHTFHSSTTTTTTTTIITAVTIDIKQTRLSPPIRIHFLHHHTVLARSLTIVIVSLWCRHCATTIYNLSTVMFAEWKFVEIIFEKNRWVFSNNIAFSLRFIEFASFVTEWWWKDWENFKKTPHIAWMKRPAIAIRRISFFFSANRLSRKNRLRFEIKPF